MFIYFALIIALLLLGLPVAFTLGGVGVLWTLIEGYSFELMASRVFAGVDKFVFIAIPFFIVAGEIMNRSGITDRLIEFSKIFVGRFKGGLAYVNVLASFLFAGMTGAALSDVSALGKIFVPAMEKQGYTRKFASAVTAASSIMGPTIPPSITIVIYAGITGVSVGAMFLAAIIPGMLIGIFQFLLIYFMAKKRSFPSSPVKLSFSKVFKVTKDSILALAMPGIILGGIASGFFTPTEAAGVAVIYAFILGFFVYKKLKVSDIPKIFLESTYQYSSLLFIIGSAGILGWIISRTGAHHVAVRGLMSISQNPTIILLIVLVFLLFMGTWLETAATVVLLAPIFHVAMVEIGFHPIYFGTLMVKVVHIGLITPPMGVCLFGVSSVADIPVEDVMVEIMPFVIASLLALAITILFPETTLYLPRLAGLIG